MTNRYLAGTVRFITGIAAVVVFLIAAFPLWFLIPYVIEMILKEAYVPYFPLSKFLMDPTDIPWLGVRYVAEPFLKLDTTLTASVVCIVSAYVAWRCFRRKRLTAMHPAVE